MDVEGVWCSRNEALQVRKTRLALLDLLGFLEPHVLRSDPVTFKWLVRTLQSVPKMRLTASGGVIQVETPLNGHGRETMWNAGLAAWNEHCEALRLQLRSSGAEGHGVTLEAILDKQIRGCFVSCGWSSAEQLRPDQTDERPTHDRPRPWNSSVDAWCRSRATTSSTRSIMTAQWAECNGPHNVLVGCMSLLVISTTTGYTTPSSSTCTSTTTASTCHYCDSAT